MEQNMNGKSTKANIFEASWFVGIASIFPGIGLLLLKKQRTGSLVMAGISLLFALFWFFPTPYTWFLFSIPYIGQVAYSVSLATLSRTSETERRSASLDKMIPKEFLNSNNGSTKIIASLNKVLDANEKTVAAIIGTTLKQVFFIGITNNNLYVANCTPKGYAQNPKPYPLESVQWTTLQSFESDILLSIEFQDQEKIELLVPYTLRKQALELIEPFPGTMERDKYIEKIQQFHKDSGRIRNNISVLVGVGVFLLGLPISVQFSEKDTGQAVLVLFAGLALFISGWSPFIASIKQIKHGRGFTYTRIMAGLSISSIILIWGWAAFLFGSIAIAIAKSLHNLH
jgi:hypothetical protein